MRGITTTGGMSNIERITTKKSWKMIITMGTIHMAANRLAEVVEAAVIKENIKRIIAPAVLCTRYGDVFVLRCVFSVKLLAY